MGKTGKNRRFKKRLGLRLIIPIGIVVMVTMIFFEYLAYVNIKEPSQPVGEFLFLHSLHTAVTLLILLALIYYIIARYVLNPIKHLLSALEELEKGKFVTSLEIKSGDEFEFLAERFNDMGFKLRDYIQHFVRLEKYKSVLAISRRLVKEIRIPCSTLGEKIKLIHNISKEDSQLSKLAELLYYDLRTVENKLNELTQIEIPEELLDVGKKHEKSF